MKLLDGKTAVVTGGSSGIDRGIARGSAEHGAAAVVVADVRKDPKGDGPPAHQLLRDETDTEAVFVECDVTEREPSTRRSRPPRRPAAST
jgi:NAD(P)-dependent dehydrogenase (short-subunit alcohol dehydrogenase family)